VKKIIAGMCVVLCVFLSACSSAPQVARVDAATQTDLTGRWNDSDVRQVCESLIASAISSPAIDAYIRDFSARNRGTLPAVIIGTFKNTSSEHIDTRIISSRMRTAIINSGKLSFVEHGNARDEIRAERDDQQVNASEKTAASIANETGANFILTGEVNSMEEKADNTTVRVYFVKATITNIETNRIIWEDENNEIKKVIRQPRLKL
jgi:uncharacterized protein (TIGR02722 family)